MISINPSMDEINNPRISSDDLIAAIDKGNESDDIVDLNMSDDYFDDYEETINFANPKSRYDYIKKLFK